MKGLIQGNGQIKTLILATNADYALNQHLLTLIILFDDGLIAHMQKETLLSYLMEHNLTISDILKNPRYTKLEKHSQIQITNDS